MRKVKKVRWDPIIAKLVNYVVKQNVSAEAIEDSGPSRVKANWVNPACKQFIYMTKEEFEVYLHDLFDREGPVIKYQNPDVWNVYPTQRQS